MPALAVHRRTAVVSGGIDQYVERAVRRLDLAHQRAAGGEVGDVERGEIDAQAAGFIAECIDAPAVAAEVGGDDLAAGACEGDADRGSQAADAATDDGGAPVRRN